MVTLYFYLDDYAPVMRLWPSVPRIGQTLALKEFGGNAHPLKVSDVVSVGDDDPSINIYLKQARTIYGSQAATRTGAASSNGRSH